MSLAALGAPTLVAALGGAGAAVGFSASGRRRRGGQALAVTLVALSFAVLALGAALVDNDGSLVYVADHTSRATSWPYRLAGLWGGMAGSLLFWTWLAAVWAVAAGRMCRRRLPELAGGVHAVLGAELVVLCGVLVAVSRPFDRLAIPAIDGGGLNPVLLHPAMLYHPPLLYAGAVGLSVPFALAVTALARQAGGSAWLEPARRWALMSLALLTLGMVAGAHWAYVELGWGGYWAWDPVENGALLPWLAGVAFLHAAASARHRPGESPRAVTALASLAFVLGLLGAFLTRSGVTDSVHAFAEARAVGWALGGALLMVTVAVAVLLARRHVHHSTDDPVPLLSGRAALAGNYVVLVGLVVVVAFGTVFPVVARWFTGGRIVVTGHYFAIVAAPLAVVLLAFIGVGPRLGFGANPWLDVRPRLRPAATGVATLGVAGLWLGDRRPIAVVMAGLAGTAAGLIVAEWRERPGARWLVSHLGVVVLLAGVAGTATGAHRTASLVPGQSVAVRGYTLRLDGVAPVPAEAGLGRAARADLSLLRDGHRLAIMRPKALVSDSGQRVSVAALRSTPLDDVQVALRAVGDGGRAVVVEIFVLPLAQEVWWGGLLVALGMALSVAQSSRPVGTTITSNGDVAEKDSSPETVASSTYP